MRWPSFMQSACILMIGIKPLLSSTFGSVDKMMSGKKYPQNFRALRMIVEEVLRPVIENKPGNIASMGDLKMYLAELSNKSKTAKLWIDCLIKPVYILMSFLLFYGCRLLSLCALWDILCTSHVLTIFHCTEAAAA